MTKINVTGDAMHTCESRELSNLSVDEFRKTMREVSDSHRDSWDTAKSDMVGISNYFSETGWPRPDKLVSYDDDAQWAYFDNSEERSAPLKICVGWWYIQRRSERLSRDYLAAKLYFAAFSFLHYFEQRDFKKTISSCAEYVRDRDILTARESFLESVARGKAVKAGLKFAGEQTSNLHAAKREERFKIMREFVPKVGVDRASVKCEEIGLGDRGAIKRQWNRHQKKYRDT